MKITEIVNDKMTTKMKYKVEQKKNKKYSKMMEALENI